MKLCMIGTGYVGLVSGTCFADSGNDVVCVDIDESKINRLNNLQVPIYEPGLEEMIRRNVEAKRLSFTTSLEQGVQQSDIIFIAVGTPAGEDGSSDLRYVLQAARDIAGLMKGPKIIVNKSTVPVGTAEKVRQEVAALTSHGFEVVSNPEFLKEGAAIDDFMKPDRVIIGTDCPNAAETMKELYKPFMRTGARILLMDPRSSEMSKYAANAMLACRISFMNEIANLCEHLGADVDWVRQGIGSDGRIGRSFLFPGVGYGGSCFPKDIKALIHMGRETGYPLELIQAVEDVNERQKSILVGKIDRFFASAAAQRLPEARAKGQDCDADCWRKFAHELSSAAFNGGGTEGMAPSDLSGRTFAIWGLSFKPRTDDMREAPSLTIIRQLLERGAAVQAYDPEAMSEARKVFGGDIRYFESNYDALHDADALLLITEWAQFLTPDFQRMRELLKHPLVFDGRNQYSSEEMNRFRFLYYRIGKR